MALKILAWESVHVLGWDIIVYYTFYYLPPQCHPLQNSRPN
jgi:hypothetical protein